MKEASEATEEKRKEKELKINPGKRILKIRKFKRRKMMEKSQKSNFLLLEVQNYIYFYI